MRHELHPHTPPHHGQRTQIAVAAARITSVATVVAIANDCAPEYNPRITPCCSAVATCAAPAAAATAANRAESASAPIGNGANNTGATAAATAPVSAANPASVAADAPTTAGTIANTTTNLLTPPDTIEKILTDPHEPHLRKIRHTKCSDVPRPAALDSGVCVDIKGFRVLGHDTVAGYVGDPP
jgi:hypothetical protein